MTHASVFSGIGGPEVAATMLGWENLFHCEINPFGRAVLDYWYPNAKSYDDITTTDFSCWRGKIDVLTGGFPCQPFSYAGQRRGAQDDRYLWPYMFKCIDAIRPTWVVAENVAGILTMVEQGQVSPMETQGTLFGEDDAVRRYRLRETFTLERICHDLESHGYAVQPVLIPACAVGAPHRRDRVFIVGRRRYVPDPSSERLQGQDQPRSGEGRERLHLRRDAARYDRPTIQRDVADTSDEELQGRNDSHKEGHGQSEDRCAGLVCETDGRGWNITDTRDAGLQEARAEQSSAGHRGFGVQTGEQVERFGRWQSIDGIERFDTNDEIAGCGRWLNFPTVSPVHRGNDGLPFDVDDLTLSPSKWRTEALKAYGNAIVPQVMYEIFRAIDLTENKG